MKKQPYLYLIALIVSILSSCNKDDNDLAQSVSLEIQIAAKEAEFSFDVSKAVVKISSNTTSASFSTTPNATDKAIFESLTPGTYDVSTTLVVDAATYTSVTGITTDEDVYFNGSAEKLQVFENTATNLDLLVGRVGNWVFKQIYYAGSHAQRGASFRDTFFEIYNNSNQIMYADSLYFGQVAGKNNNRAEDYTQSNFQYDWSKSVGMVTDPGLNANTDYIYAHNIFMIPSDGTGKKYPVNPGESIIIATNAINHAAPYVDNDGGTVSVQDPSLTVDLSKADFETYLAVYLGAPYKYDIDNTNVPDVDVIYAAGHNDMILDANGRDAFYLYKAAADQVPAEELPLYASPDVKEITATSKKFKQIPVHYIEDAVEVQNPVEASRVPKRLPISLDAVRTHVPEGRYSSQSLIRKTAKIVNGRRILQDTNNSSEDFGYFERPNVSKSASSFLD
ncbi:DUF4876 domain-containing protein [Sphingobacterium gobiense]|uniref:DUF4876 domain-containing protein n=1 Tax=Sphingobacterium gobiense TaxID=1382456 RepID=A0A2S9JTX4_9SPHI|nr:DUF4876 domain-containing protein [Sphingobacterium gobiense]PRD56680.1 hypothetical protein C5749_05470 [Sphingobacterium gobiense]